MRPSRISASASALTALLTAAILAGGASADSDWRGYGHGLANRRSQPEPGDVSPGTAGTLRTAWQVREQGLDDEGAAPFVTSTPAVVRGLAVWGDWQGDVHAVAVGSGRPRWTTHIPGPGIFESITDSPAISHGRVFVGTGSGWVVALDRRTGRHIWTRIVDRTPLTDLFSSPTVVGDTVVIGVASAQVATPGPYSFYGSVVGLDARTGKIRWRTQVQRPHVDGPGGSVWSTAAADRELGLVYIGTGQAYEKPAGPRTDALLALRPSDGHLVWKRQFTTDDLFNYGKHLFGRDYDIGASPNLFTVGGRRVVGVGDKAGRYAVLDGLTGATVWRRKLCPGSHLGGVMTTAAVAGGSIFAACNDLENTNELADASNRTVVLALDAETGATRWTKRVPGGTVGAVTEAGGVVFVPNTLGTVRAFAAAGGRLLWHARPGGAGHRTDHGIAGGVSVAGGRVLVPFGYVFLLATTAPPEDGAGGVRAYRVRSPRPEHR